MIGVSPNPTQSSPLHPRVVKLTPDLDSDEDSDALEVSVTETLSGLFEVCHMHPSSNSRVCAFQGPIVGPIGVCICQGTILSSLHDRNAFGWVGADIFLGT